MFDQNFIVIKKLLLNMWIIISLIFIKKGPDMKFYDATVNCQNLADIMGLSDRNIAFVGKAGYSILLHSLRGGKTHSMAGEESIF